MGGGRTLWVSGLGSFRIFWVVGWWTWGKIGFVLHNRGAADGGDGANWVRFAEFGGVGTLGMLRLGSFRIFGEGDGGGAHPALKVRVNHRMHAFGVRSI